jgi:hypothetical protein
MNTAKRKRAPLAPEDGVPVADRQREALARKASILGRLGVPEDRAHCDVCGTADLEHGLRRIRRRLLEWHHLAGLHDGPVMLLCQNCHTKRTALMRLWPTRLLTAERTQPERLAAFLHGIADHHAILSEAFLSASRYVQRLGQIAPAERVSKLGDPFQQKVRKDE